MIRASLIGLAVSLICGSAAADLKNHKCDFDLHQAGKQVDAFNISIKNQTDKDIWLSMDRTAGPTKFISAKSSKTHRIEIKKDTILLEQADTGLLDIHADIGVGAGNQVGDKRSRILRLVFDISNALTGETMRDATRKTSLTTRKSLNGPLAPDYRVQCSATFDDKGTNAWAYLIQIADR